MTYEQYLFSQLLALYNVNFSGEAYDIQYENALTMYAEFEQSPFNSDTTGIYQCITNFLQYKYPQTNKQ
jgi:hypothetical protein